MHVFDAGMDIPYLQHVIHHTNSKIMKNAHMYQDSCLVAIAKAAILKEAKSQTKIVDLNWLQGHSVTYFMLVMKGWKEADIAPFLLSNYTPPVQFQST